MRYLITYIFIFYFVQNSTGQTYIGPVIGYDFARLQSNCKGEDDCGFFKTEHYGFVRKSPVFGLKIEQYIFKSIYFSFESTITHKYIDAIVTGTSSFPVYGIEFNYFQQYFTLKWRIIKSIYIGAGYNYNYIYRFNWDSYEKYYENANGIENGFHLSTGVKYRNLDLEVYFYNGKSRIKQGDFATFELDPLSSFGFKLSYDLKVFDRLKLFGTKSHSCPSFKY